MANSFMLQHTNFPPLSLFLRKRNVGVVDNVRFCQTRINDHGRGSAGLSLQIIRQKSVAPSLKIRAQRHASGDDSSSWKPLIADYGVKYEDSLFGIMAKYYFLGYQIMVMDKWLSSLSRIPALKDNSDFSNEAHDCRENKIKKFWEHIDEMSRLNFNPTVDDQLKAIYDGISEVFERHEPDEDTRDKVKNDITFAIMYRDFRGTAILPRIKEMGKILSTIPPKRTRLLDTDPPSLVENEIVKCFEYFAARLTDVVECSISDLPIFVQFSAENQEFMNSLNLRCPTHDQVQLGAYDLLYQIICTTREVNSLLLELAEELKPYLDDGYLQYVKDGKRLMRGHFLELKNSCSYTIIAEIDFKSIETAIRDSHGLNYNEAFLEEHGQAIVNCISGYNQAMEGFKKLSIVAVG